MNIRIDDDVPLPQPDKPDTWVSGPKAAPHIVYESNPSGDNWVKERFIDAPKRVPMKDLEIKWTPVEEANQYRMDAEAYPHIEAPSRYPAETTYDAKGVPTVDCYLVGGPLNGRHGPIVGTAQVVELDIYAADGSVSSVELYELGDRKELGCRYHKGTKP